MSFQPYFACPNCGSRDVTVDGALRWNADGEYWKFEGEPYDKSGACGDCEHAGMRLTWVDKVPKVGELWQHYRGGTYAVLHLANQDATDTEQFPPTVVYQAIDDERIWSRPTSEFLAKFSIVVEP